MSVESPPPPPPTAKVVQQPMYTAPSAYTKPSAPPMTINPGYTYAYNPQQQYQYPYQQQTYPPQQYQQYQLYQQPRYVVAQPYQQQQGPSTGMAVAGGVIAGMLAANVLDDIGDP